MTKKKKLSANRKVALVLFVCAIGLYVVQTQSSLSLLSFTTFQGSKTFNLDIHGLTTQVDLTVPREMFDYYREKERGDAELHIRNPLTGTDQFYIQTPSVGQTFQSELTLTNPEAIPGLRGWQLEINYDYTKIIVETFSWGSTFYTDQQRFSLSLINNTIGRFCLCELGYTHAVFIPAGSHILATITWSVKMPYVIDYMRISRDGHETVFISDPEANVTEPDEGQWLSGDWVYNTKNVELFDAVYGFGLHPSSEFAGVMEGYRLFVAPKPFQTFAQSLRAVYSDDEDYTNAVLQMLHQEQYITPSGPHYAAIPFGQGWGDCDTWSIALATLLKAVNIRCVLLAYAGHMNVGVALSHTPRDVLRGTAFGHDINSIKYWMAECTGQGGAMGWRVGEIPSDNLRSIQGYQPLETVDMSDSSYHITYNIQPSVQPTMTENMLLLSCGAGGSTSMNVGVYALEKGSRAVISATPNEGYIFDHWILDTEALLGNPLTVIMDESHVLHASFKTQAVGYYTLNVHATINSEPLKGASVRLVTSALTDEALTDASGTASWTLQEGSSASVTITYGSQTKTFDVVMTSDQTVRADFLPESNPFSIQSWVLSLGLGLVGLVLWFK